MNNKSESDFIVVQTPGARYIQGEIVHEDELSLFDLWRILVKRKKVFFSTLIIIIAAAALWIFTSKPIYESRAVLVIGKVAPVGQLESPQTLMQRLRETYKVDDPSEGSRVLPLVKDVGLVNKAAPDTIEISVWGYSSAQAQSFLKGVIEKILSAHKMLYELGIAEQNKLLDSLHNHRQEIKNALLETRRRISQGDADPSVSGLLALEMDTLSSQLPELDQKEAQLRLSLSELQSKGTAVIRQPTLPAGPIKPKPALYMAIAIVIGLIFGVMAVYIIEFLANVRADDSKETADIGLPL